ncbi:hypothetical protein ACP8H2_09800 [Bacillus subtilis]|uniref:hypothetical protein n=1 Tax=Bacillus subtilis TaxID=1423 RepID=UPI003CF25158
MNLRGMSTYYDLQVLYGLMEPKYIFKHKKTGYTLEKFFVSFKDEREIPYKTEVFYEVNNRRYNVQIKNLYKHFEIVEEEKEGL